MIHVALPLGIGDCHWSLMKMRALKELHGGDQLVAHVNESIDHRTVGYLRLVTFIDQAVTNSRAPYDIDRELPNYRDPRWTRLDGCKNWRGFDYVLVANAWVESGRHIRDWLPELRTDYQIALRSDPAAEQAAASVSPSPPVLLYPSGLGPNEGFHGNWWTPEKWATVVNGLNARGVRPVLMGASTPGDLGYRHRLLDALHRTPGVQYVDAIGKTDLQTAMVLLRRARAWCGLNSGLGIVAASMGTPTLMFWADSRWPIGSVHFQPLMQTSWLSEEQLRTYRTLSYGSPEMVPDRVVEILTSIGRRLPDYSDWLGQGDHLQREHAHWVCDATTRLDVTALVDLCEDEKSVATVLDLGCGTGSIAARLPATVRYVGVDSCESALVLARQRHESGRYVLADLRAITEDHVRGWLDQPRADVVVALRLLKHFGLHEWEDVLARVLRLGRRALFSMPISSREVDDGSEFHHVWVSYTFLHERVERAGHRIVAEFGPVSREDVSPAGSGGREELFLTQDAAA